MLLPAPGFISLGQEVFSDELSGTSKAVLLVSITLWKLFSRQLKHLSKCSTWLLPVLYYTMPAPLHLSVSLPVWRITWKMKFSGNESTLYHLSLCTLTMTRMDLSCIISCFPYLFTTAVKYDSGSMRQPKAKDSIDIHA